MEDEGQDSYDAEWVASAAMQADPSLEHEVAQALAVEAKDHLAAVGGAADVAELARRLFGAHPELGATTTNVVARAAVDFVNGGSSNRT